MHCVHQACAAYKYLISTAVWSEAHYTSEWKKIKRETNHLYTAQTEDIKILIIIEYNKNASAPASWNIR